MKAFRYEGLSSSGAKIEGIVEAFDRQEAISKAHEHCRVLSVVEPVGSGNVSGLLNADIGLLLSGGKIKPKKLSLLSSQLAIELKAGLPLVQSIRLVAENEEDKNLKKILNEVADDVHSGHGLDESFDRLKKYYEDSAAVASKVGSAMIYPTLLIAVAIVVVIIIMVKAVPVFEDSFSSMGNELPAPTQMLISMSHFMTDNLLLLIIIVAAIAMAVILYSKTEHGRHFIAKLALTFPGVGMVNKMSAASQFSATLSTMLSSGLPLVQAVRITAATSSNLLIMEDLEYACNGVLEGNTLTHGLRKSNWLPNLLLEMTAVGEQTGNLEETLTVVSDYYNKEVDTAVKRALDILNPAITMFLAAIVVFILLSVYLPLFSMYGSI